MYIKDTHNTLQAIHQKLT